MSAILEVVNKIFNELVSSNALVKLRERGNPLVSEYVFKYGGKCLGSNLEDDFSIEREVTWYQVLTLGIGVKPGTVILSMITDGSLFFNSSIAYLAISTRANVVSTIPTFRVIKPEITIIIYMYLKIIALSLGIY
ncbi:MAG: hypothetical protein RXN78_07515 [Vulcanisaeta sp.]